MISLSMKLYIFFIACPMYLRVAIINDLNELKHNIYNVPLSLFMRLLCNDEAIFLVVEFIYSHYFFALQNDFVRSF